MKRILFIVIIASIVLLVTGFVSAVSCYPTLTPTQAGGKVYLGTAKVGNLHAHTYGKPYASIDKKVAVDFTSYIWNGAPCTDETYLGRAGGKAYIRRSDGRTCIDSLYLQFKLNANSWPTINIPGGWCGKKEDVGIYIAVTVAPYLIKYGAVSFKDIASSVFKNVPLRLPWPGYPNPVPIPTYI
jgi:hypothetical protein